jgi:hypothetical protein
MYTAAFERRAVMTRTETAIQAIREIANIIEETAREAGALGVPSGVVYAALMGVGINLDTYQALLASMEQAGRIKLSGDLIRAVG